MAIALARWSVEDYHRMIAAGILGDRQVELLAGDIVEISPEGPLHASRIRKVANYLRSLLNGLALVSEAHPITLSDSEPEPDVAITLLLYLTSLGNAILNLFQTRYFRRWKVFR